MIAVFFACFNLGRFLFKPDFNGWGLIGNLKWLGLEGVGQSVNPDYAPTIPHMAFMLFQMMFAVITPALISGAMVERIKFGVYLVFTLLWSMLIYNEEIERE